MIVTIDGPAGSGKSTAARRLADRLGFRFLDTGAMYRAVAWECLRRGAPLDDCERIGKVAREVEISLDGDAIYCGDEDVTEKIRSTEVTRAASVVALNADVRAAMVELQRKLAKGLHVITEGRDQGTVAFPDADFKFFFEADPGERASRRHRELAQAGNDVSYEEILAQIRERDLRDATRDVAPLKPASDAVRVDTTRLTADEVLELLEQTVQQKQT